jgi:hypothetical protein
MIDLDIDGEYGLQSDQMQIILGKHSTRERDGEQVHTLNNKSYHKNIKSALTTYARKRLKDGGEITDFEELVKVQTITNEILEGIESELKKANEQFLKEK